MPELDHQSRPLRISLTPLIDVVFILLLFFMLASTFSHWQQMTLSNVAQGKPSAALNFPVQIFVLTGGEVRYDSEIYQLTDLDFMAVLQSIHAEQGRLLVTPEAGATIQDVVRVMDGIVGAGIENVSLTSSFDER